MKNMKVIDLSWKLSNDIKLFPGASPIQINKAINKDPVAETELTVIDSFCMHYGTHLDCPGHMVPGGFHVDDKPADYYTGNGIVIDCSHIKAGEKIPADILDGVDLSDKDYIFFYIAWAKNFGTDNQYVDYPVLSPELAKKIGGMKDIKGIGIETNNIDVTGDDSYQNHRGLLGNNDKVIYEAITNLELLLGKDFYFSGLPINVESGEGSVVRAVAYVQE